MVGGTGDEGYGLALRWAAHGYEIIIGSRTTDRAQAAAENIRKTLSRLPKVTGLVNQDAVLRADIVVLAVPFSGLVETIKALKPHFKSGQTVVNVTVPLETTIGGRATRTLGLWDGSAGQLAARLLPKHVRLVTAFNNVSAAALNELSKPVECDVLVCGDDEEAKKIVFEIGRAIPNVQCIDAGTLENSRTVEQLTALLVSLNVKYNIKNAGLRITGIQQS
ncbi:MAG TPA: NADPH-dependent F420 reductase [Candidatus Bathyarchaeia archaeon]|nr:NADPH-dependent F420 reductase [Candidatus Bathyarchaeia archaeon]